MVNSGRCIEVGQRLTYITWKINGSLGTYSQNVARLARRRTSVHRGRFVNYIENEINAMFEYFALECSSSQPLDLSIVSFHLLQLKDINSP